MNSIGDVSVTPVRVLVVDDEAPARQRIVQLLRQDPWVAEILEADNGMTAVDLIREEQPDLLFLDVRMPQLDGFGVIQALANRPLPHIIFVTGHDTYAVRAFEIDAADYLVKPFGDARFLQTMTRAKERLSHKEIATVGPNVAAVLSNRARSGALWDRLVVKSGGITRFLMANEIDWIEANDVYVTLHVKGKEFLYRASLREMTTRLDPMLFVRIHRSVIVNIERIKELESAQHSEFEVTLIDGTQLHISRRFRALLEKRLGQSL